jgi:hypothetical protein
MDYSFLKNIKLFFLLPAFCWALSCTKVVSPVNIENNALTQDGVLTDTSYYTDVTIDGVRTFYISGQKGSGMYFGGNGTRYAGITNNFSTMDSNGFYYNTNYIEFNKYESPELFGPISKYNVSTFNQWIASNYAAGKYDYYNNTATLSVKNGMVLVWTDGNGAKWQTNIGEQSGSSFTILKTEVLQGQNTGYITHTIITAIFNCKLYDNKGNIKLLTNGKLRLTLWI